MPIIIIILFSASSFFAHDYHMGYTEVFYNKDNKSIETSIKLFTDDLNKTISNQSELQLNLNNENELIDSDKFIETYLSKNFEILVNGKSIEYQYLGKEYDEDVTWIYIEAAKIKKIKKFSITNRLLFDAFDDQKNFININIDGKIRSTILEKGFSNYNFIL